MARARVLSPAQQQLPGCGAEDLLEQGRGGGFVGAECVLEPAAGAADAPAAPVIRVPRVVDAGDQMRLPVRVRAVTPQDGLGGVQDGFVFGHVVPQRIQAP